MWNFQKQKNLHNFKVSRHTRTFSDNTIRKKQNSIKFPTVFRKKWKYPDIFRSILISISTNIQTYLIFPVVFQNPGYFNRQTKTSHISRSMQKFFGIARIIWKFLDMSRDIGRRI